MKNSVKRLKVLVIAVALLLSSTAAFTSAHVALAGAPSGCYYTYTENGCSLCSNPFKKKKYFKYEYTCPNGSNGSGIDRQSCGSC